MSLPLFLVIILTYQIFSTNYDTFVDVKKLKVGVELSIRATNVVHELQKERGLTAGFLASKGKKFNSDLNRQREMTNQKIKLFFDYYNGVNINVFMQEFQNSINSGISSLKKLDSIRSNISRLNISLKDAITFYTSSNKFFLDTMSMIANESRNLTLTAKVNALSYFLNAKEKAGIERAVVNGILSKNSNIDNNTFLKWNSLYFGQNFLLETFNSFADSNTKSFFEQTFKGDAVNEVNKIREVIKKKANFGEFGIEPNFWFKMSTKRIDLLREVALFQKRDSSKLIDDLISENLNNLITYTSIILIILIMIFIAVFFISKKLTSTLKNSIASIDDINHQLANTSGQISSFSTLLAEGATSQASSVEEVSASIEESTALINENVKNSKNAVGLANSTNNLVQNESEKINEMVNSINQVNSSSEQIAKIIKVIDEIAFQTNLLALNAAVEAARAGEHGLGFAVVAEEVKSLATRSSKAAHETAGIISESIEHIKSANSAVKETKESFSNISINIDEVAKLITNITDATTEQAEGMGQVALAMSEIDTTIQQNAASAEESAAGTEELNAQIQTMLQIVENLAILVKG